MPKPGWQRWLASLCMALGGLLVLPDLAFRGDPVARAEARVRALDARLARELSRAPLWRELAAESGARTRIRREHPVREVFRLLLISAAALALAWGILRRRGWATPLLALGLIAWAVRFVLDLLEMRSILGYWPWLSGPAQCLNLLFLAGLLAWLARDERLYSPS